MKLSAEMHQVLSRLNLALFQQDHAALQATLESVDLQTLLSQNTIAVARGMGKSPLVMLLNTLAYHNEVEPRRAQLWLACYQSLVHQSLDPVVLQLSRDNVLRKVTEALIAGQSLVGIKGAEIKGSAQAWVDAIELAIDHKDWVTAECLLGVLGNRMSETQTWLQIARSLSQRHPLYVDETGMHKLDVDYRALARLYVRCAQAARNAKAESVDRALRHLSASALEMAGDFDAAIQAIAQLDPQGKSMTCRVDMARCHCKQGDLLGAIASLDEALAILLQNPNPGDLEDAALQGQQEAARASDKGFNIAKASRALSDLASMARKQNIDLFLVSGTLLGYEREGQLLAHDKDIDVGLIGWEKQFDLCLALQESGLFNINPQFLRGHLSYYIPIQHIATGMWIDVFVYHPQGDKLVTGVDFFFGYRQTFAFTPFELKEIEFLGVKMNAPANAELNLEENFGNWRVPDASYISHLESPSTENKGGLPFMLTARLNAVGAVMKNKSAKMAKIAQLMAQYSDLPGAMSSTLLVQFSKRLETAPMDAQTTHLQPLPEFEVHV